MSPVSDSYGKQGLVPATHRIAMAKLALQSSNWVTVDEWESQQPDWTETVVTMRYNSAIAFASWEKEGRHGPSERQCWLMSASALSELFVTSCLSILYL